MKSIPYERPPGDVVPETSLLASTTRLQQKSALALRPSGARTLPI
jgi:hypothetical protein